MLYILLFISILTETVKNIFSNHFSKTRLNTFADAIFFNIICSVGSILFCVFLPLEKGISAYSCFMAFLFSLTTTGSLLFSLLAMKTGPMSYSVLFSYLGMVISTVFGIVYFKQNISVMQIVGFILMLITFYIGTDAKKNEKISVKWLFYAFMSFVMCGLLGIIQLLHQSSAFAHEINIFMLYSFVFSLALSLFVFMFLKKPERKCSVKLIKSNIPFIGIVSGVFYGAVNVINLYLSGKMPSIIFFPVVNGGVLILSSIAAITVFREKCTARQTIGIITGIVAVCLLGI